MQDLLDILVLGNGGREAAIADKLRKSRRCRNLYSAHDCNIEGFPDASDFEAVASFCLRNHIDLVVVGPEKPVVDGIRDFLAAIPELSDLKIIAPSAEAARLEGSKEFAKEFMDEAGIPSPRFMSVDEETLDEGISFLDSLQPPYVIKADGLDNGCGVAVIDSLAEAKDFLEELVVDGIKGEAGRTVLIEQYINGPECSVMTAIDGKDFLLLPVSHDYKRLLDDDCGANTAGMGAYSPVAFADDEFMAKVVKRIITPTLEGLKCRGIDYQGFLYFGIMNIDGEPVLLEYNVRLGDPETQAVLPLIKSDFVDVLEGIADRTVGLKKLETSADNCVAVVVASEGYPGRTVESGRVVEGIAEARMIQGVNIFPGAMVLKTDGEYVSSGARVFTVSSTACSLRGASDKAYEAIGKIYLEGAVFRSDIGREGGAGQ